MTVLHLGSACADVPQHFSADVHVLYRPHSCFSLRSCWLLFLIHCNLLLPVPFRFFALQNRCFPPHSGLRVEQLKAELDQVLISDDH